MSKNMQENAVNSVDTKRSSSSAKKNLTFTAEQLKRLHWVEGKSLTQIGASFGVSCAAIDYWMRKLGLAGRRHLDNLLFEPSPALSYVLGVLFGDGCVYVREKGNFAIRLCVCDKVFAEKFSEAVRLLGFNAGNLIRVKAQCERYRDRWLSCFYSDAFGNWYTSMTLDERLELGARFPDAFVRGFYESEGTLVRHRGRLELSMSDTHADGAIISAIQKMLPKGIESKKYMFHREPPCKDVHVLSIFRGLDVRRFLAWTMPCMKTVPRSEVKETENAESDETQVNTEPIPGRDAEAGVENTKVTQTGGRVGLRSVTDDVQPSGRPQPPRCIPTYTETCRAQQKWSAPGRAVTFQ